MDMHGPIAGISPDCSEDGVGRLGGSMTPAVACVSRMVADLVTDLRREAGDDTVIVVSSDHLAHLNDLTPRMDPAERRNLPMVFAPGLEPRVIERPGATIDVFPTILDAMGLLDPDTTRAGLGASLLSDGRTLVERYGVASLDAKSKRDGDLARMIWSPDGASLAR
jgi:phosphoglycerol transferase